MLKCQNNLITSGRQVLDGRTVVYYHSTTYCYVQLKVFFFNIKGIRYY